MVSVAGLNLIKCGCYITSGLTGYAAYQKISFRNREEMRDAANYPFTSKIIRTLEIASRFLSAMALYKIGEAIVPKIAFAACLHQAALPATPFVVGAFALYTASMAVRNYIRPEETL